jgi:hypothetical protein
MTLDQIRLFLEEGERLERQRRAAFIADVHMAASGFMGDGDHVQQRIDELLRD